MHTVHKLSSMQLLRGLRLNCFLAALVPCLLACLGLGYQQYTHQQKLLNAHADEAIHSLNSYALLLADPATRNDHIALINNADERWNTLAIVSLNEEHNLIINTLSGKAQHLENDNPHPALIKSQISPQHWQIGHLHMGLASPLRYQDQDVGVLYGELYISEADNNSILLIIGSLTVLCGTVLALYLSHRIYKPIEYLCEEAEAVMNGKTSSAAIRQSTETAHIASSISDLLLKFQGLSSSSSSESVQESQTNTQHE